MTFAVPKPFKPVARELSRIGKAWHDSHASTFGASVAYYTIFSIAPLLIIVVSIAGLVVTKDAARTGVIDQFTNVFGQNGAGFVQSLLDASTSTGGNIFLIVIGFAIVLLGASGIFSQLEAALDSIFESTPKKSRSIVETIEKKLLSLGMVMSVGFLLLASLAASAVITAFSHSFSYLIPGGAFLANITIIAGSFVLISLFLSLIFAFLPSQWLGWNVSLIGGFIAGTFFTIGKFALGIYLGSTASLNVYGSAAALVLIIVWTYYMSQIFFLSAILLKLYIVPRRQ